MATETDAATVPESPPRSGWTDQTRAFTVRYLRTLARTKVVLFWSIAFPTAFYLLTITVFVPTDQIPADVLPQVKAVTAVGYGTFGAIIVCLNTFGQSLVQDIEQGRYDQFRALPLAPTADLAGRMLAGLAFAFGAYLTVTVVSVLTGAAYAVTPASLPVVVLALAAFSVLWMVVAVFVAAAVSDPRYANVVTISIAMAAYFLTGYNGTQPGAFGGPAWLLNALPNTLATRTITRATVDLNGGALTPPAMPDPPVAVGLLAGYAVVTLVVGVAGMCRLVYGRGVLA